MERECVHTQLIAHEKEVYDIAWGGVGVFASVSADDLRDKEHSTIIYESSEPDTPLVRLGWNKQDPRYMDTAKVVILDIRYPTLPVVELEGHQGSANAITWAPHSASHICSVGDDRQALIWDVSSIGKGGEAGLDPILAYTADAEIEQLQWSSSQPDWVAIAFSNKLQILRMSNKRKSDTNCTWTTKMDGALILSYHHAHIAGQRANGQFTQEAFASIVKDLQEQFPTKLLDKAKIRNRMKNIKKNWVRCYDIFKGGHSGFGWDPILQNWTAEADVWKQLIEAKPEAAEWKNKPFRHYNEMVEMFGYDRATGESAVIVLEMRHLLATEIDESASTDAPVDREINCLLEVVLVLQYIQIRIVLPQ